MKWRCPPVPRLGRRRRDPRRLLTSGGRDGRAGRRRRHRGTERTARPRCRQRSRTWSRATSRWTPEAREARGRFIGPRSRRPSPLRRSA